MNANSEVPSAASFAELLKEAALLAEHVKALEDEMIENVLRTEKILSGYNEREKNITLASLSSINAIFSALPARGTQFESGSIVLRTCDYNGRRLLSLCSQSSSSSSSSTAATTTTTIPVPGNPLSPSAKKESRNSVTMSSPVNTAQASPSLAPLGSPLRRRRSSILGGGTRDRDGSFSSRSRSGSLSLIPRLMRASQRVRCVRGVGGKSARVVGKIEFRSDYSERVPNVYAWLEFPASCHLPVRQLNHEITVTERGFEFDIEAPGGDVGFLNNGIVHWLAVPKPRRNTVLEAIIDPLLKAKKEGRPVEISTDVDKVISKFLHTGGADQTDNEGRTLLHIAAHKSRHAHETVRQ